MTTAKALEAATELLICTTCRPADAPRDAEAAGQTLFDSVQDALAFAPAPAPGLQLRGIACLGACSRSCSVALQAPGKASYVFGELAPDDGCVQAVLEVARQHAASDDGFLLWGQRPERLRRGLIARLPMRAGLATGDGDA